MFTAALFLITPYVQQSTVRPCHRILPTIKGKDLSMQQPARNLKGSVLSERSQSQKTSCWMSTMFMTLLKQQSDGEAEHSSERQQWQPGVRRWPWGDREEAGHDYKGQNRAIWGVLELWSILMIMAVTQNYRYVEIHRPVHVCRQKKIPQ